MGGTWPDGLASDVVLEPDVPNVFAFLLLLGLNQSPGEVSPVNLFTS